MNAIADRITGALSSDTVKNPKLNVNSTSPFFSAHSYPTGDPQCSSHPPNLHLNLPVLEVLAHALILGDSKPFDTLADLGSCVNIILLYLFKKLKIRLLEEINHVFGLVDKTKSYPVRIIRDVEVHIGKLKLLSDFYVIDIKKDPETPLLVGRGILTTANVVIDYGKAKIAVGEGITRVKEIDVSEEESPYWTTLGKREKYKQRPSSDGVEWEIAKDAEINPFKDVLVFRRMVEFCKSEVKLHCSCNRYEAYGLLCRHAFYVLRMNNVKEFPKNYLHKRWLKNVKPSSFGRRRITGASDVVQNKMKELLNQVEINVPMVLKVSSKAVMSAMLGVDEPDNVLIRNPNLSKVKGMDCFSRMKPVAAVTTEELAKRRTCSVCGGKEGYNKRTCTNEVHRRSPRYKLLQSNKLLSLKDLG
ncbi:FAR1 DNA binding domain, zinc finger, SWIM-type, MULE transposase domain containing protein [Tanacetum coccineum]